MLIIIRIYKCVSTTTTILAEVAELVETLFGTLCDKTVICLIINKIKQNMQKISNILKEW